MLLFHGNTMNFYTGALRLLPPVLTRTGFARLAFDRRGHDHLATRDSRLPAGGEERLQTVADCDRFYAGRGR